MFRTIKPYFFSDPQLDSLLKAEPVKGSNDPTQARIQLSQHQERQNHVRHLYKLAISLAADITGAVQQPVRCGHEDRIRFVSLKLSGQMLWFEFYCEIILASSNEEQEVISHPDRKAITYYIDDI